jgi:hypothetical protein
LSKTPSAILIMDGPGKATDPGSRSGLRLSRIRGGERTWQITVQAEAGAEAPRAAVQPARELNAELTLNYPCEAPVERST